MHSSIYYFAYGSNLTPSRLIARIGCCENLGRALLPGFSLEFRKFGRDGSSKCDLSRTDDGSDIAEGVIYKMPATARPVLDRFEGVGDGYSVETILSSPVSDGGVSPLACFVYLADPPYAGPEVQPYCWYREFVLEGGRRHGFSKQWIDFVTAHPVTDDADASRRTLNRTILESNTDEALSLFDRKRAT